MSHYSRRNSDNGSEAGESVNSKSQYGGAGELTCRFSKNKAAPKKTEKEKVVVKGTRKLPDLKLMVSGEGKNMTFSSESEDQVNLRASPVRRREDGA